MRRALISVVFAFVAVVSLQSTSFAQKNVQPAYDPLLEKDAKHNLDVAWQAFRPAKKAYKQVLLRFEETFAAYPEFSGMDEFLYLAGMSSYYLSKNTGKQKVNLKSEREKTKYDPERLREDAIAYLNSLIEKYPDTPRKGEAEKILAELKGTSATK
ncbi:MAG TPA: outer membrane protein assembly factor BamD [Pyrinomonadaceae bacterium]|nr:outer membrane protein assembly factor BamD [Pyrinomonadaceae bacterium]